MKRPPATALFLSPHLDDAVFSCAGLMRELEDQGARVIVATVFTHGDAGHALRRAEDDAAAALLGFTTVHLGHCDAPFREPGYRTFRELLFGWHAEDAATVAAVRADLRGLRGEHGAMRVFAPLGVGTHVDHRVVHEAAMGDGTDEVCFYEERPYAYARGLTELRLAQLGVSTAAVDKQVLLKDYRQLPFVRRYLMPGAETVECEHLLLSAPAAEACLTATSTRLDCDAAARQEAARCYASQYSAFCGDAAEHALLDQRHSVHCGSQAARCERYWNLKPLC